MPNSTYIGYNALLSEMSVLYKNHKFIADDIWKPVLVKSATGNYRVFDKTHFNVSDTLVGVRMPSASADFGWHNDVYAVQRHSFSTFVYDDEKQEVEADVDLSTMAVQWIKEKLLLEQEVISFGPSSPINTASQNGGSTSLDLSNLSTADWKTFLNAAAINIETTAGVSPNVMVMNPDVMRNIVATSQFQNSIQYVLPTTQVGGIMLPSELLGIPVKYVQAIANTNPDGLAPSLARIMPNNIWVGYVDPNPTQKYGLTYGCRFWNKDRVVVDRSLDPEADKYINDYNWVNKVIAQECGYLGTCVLASGY